MFFPVRNWESEGFEARLDQGDMGIDIRGPKGEGVTVPFQSRAVPAQRGCSKIFQLSKETKRRKHKGGKHDESWRWGGKGKGGIIHMGPLKRSRYFGGEERSSTENKPLPIKWLGSFLSYNSIFATPTLEDYYL